MFPTYIFRDFIWWTLNETEKFLNGKCKVVISKIHFFPLTAQQKTLKFLCPLQEAYSARNNKFMSRQTWTNSKRAIIYRDYKVCIFFLLYLITILATYFKIKNSYSSFLIDYSRAINIIITKMLIRFFKIIIQHLLYQWFQRQIDAVYFDNCFNYLTSAN